MKKKLNEWGKNRDPFIFLIDFECKQPLAWRMDEVGDTVKFVFPGAANAVKKVQADSNIDMRRSPIDLLSYKKMFDYVKGEIEYGNSFLTNLTCRTPVTINCTLEQLFYTTAAKYSFYLKNEFVCFSPETFVQINGNKIYSYPMKGTIDASIPNAKQLILSDEKEKAEHATIVDLIRNDLSRVAKRVEVNRYRYYEEIKTNLGVIGQISSEIMGELEPDFNERIGDILFELLPAGSVSGAPKKKTLEIIKNAEKLPRGYYTGVAGYFDGNNLDSCVLIRYVDKDNIYYSGGGITSQSNLENEYSEMIKKIYVPIH
ncbi:MAG: aminodeoxychorismate synthase component I [bacterium]|jgi:para-aminobenzoate synthetase component 1